jgi:hypothetical protein
MPAVKPSFAAPAMYTAVSLWSSVAVGGRRYARFTKSVRKAASQVAALVCGLQLPIRSGRFEATAVAASVSATVS